MRTEGKEFHQFHVKFTFPQSSQHNEVLKSQRDVIIFQHQHLQQKSDKEMHHDNKKRERNVNHIHVFIILMKKKLHEASRGNRGKETKNEKYAVYGTFGANVICI